LALAGGFMVVAGAVAAGLRRELREAERGWEQRALELEVLHQVVEADTAATDADAWIRRVTEILASTLYPDDVGFLFVDGATGTLRPHPSYHGLGPDVERISVPIGAGITGTVARDGQPLLVPDVRRDPRYIPIAPRGRAELCVPVRVGGRVVGVLNVESRRPGVLTQEDVHLMATIADHVGAVLAREEILRSERQARQKAESLEQVAAVLNSTLEWEALLDRVLEELARLVPSDGTSVQLLEGDRCRIVAIRGFDGVDGLLNMTFPLGGENPNRQVIRERRPVLLPDAPAAYPIFRRHVRRAPGGGSLPDCGHPGLGRRGPAPEHDHPPGWGEPQPAGEPGAAASPSPRCSRGLPHLPPAAPPPDPVVAGGAAPEPG